MAGCTWKWIFNRQKNCWEHRCIDGVSPNRRIDYCESPQARTDDLGQMLVEMPVTPAMPGEVFISQSPGPGLYNIPPGGWVYSDSFGPMPFGSFGSGIGSFGGGTIVFVRDFHTKEIIEAQFERPEDTPLPSVLPPLTTLPVTPGVPAPSEPTTYTEVPSQPPSKPPVAVPESAWINATIGGLMLGLMIVVTIGQVRKRRG